MPKQSRGAESSSEPKPPEELKVHPLIAFEPRLVARSAFKNAPYNPRRITEQAKKRLTKSLKKGVVEGPVWNERTGNLCGFHQRLAVLDALSDTPDYLVPTQVVNVSDVREREINLSLNNPELGGQFVMDGLEAVVNTPGIDLDGTGFDTADVYRLFGGAGFDGDARAGDKLTELSNELHKTRDAYGNIVQKSQKKRDSPDFYTVLVFPNDEARDKFHEAFGLNDSCFQNGNDFVDTLAQLKAK